MPRSTVMLSGLIALGLAAGLAGPTLAGDFNVSASSAAVHNVPPPPPRPQKPSPNHNPPAAVAAVRG